MKRIVLAALVLSLAACKSKEEPAKTAPAAASKASPLEVPRDVVFAASNVVRVVDVGLGQVVAGIDLKRAISAIEFSSDGTRAFVGASDGVREVSVEDRRVIAELTKSPVRQLLRSPDGSRLVVLEHDVNMASGKPEPTPFRARFIDIATGKTDRVEEIGERILGVIPSFGPGRWHVVVEESGRVVLGGPGTPLSAGEKIDLGAGMPSKHLIARNYLALSSDGRMAYVPVEGTPSRIIAIDLERGTHRALNVGADTLLRGLAVSPDGSKLFVNGAKNFFVMPLSSGGGEIQRLDLGAPHTGAALSSDGRRLYLAQTIHEGGGAVTIVDVDRLRIAGKIHIDDISPWTIAVQPLARHASLR